MVITAAAETCRRMLVLWVDLVRRMAWFVTLVSVLLTVGVGYYVATNLRINTDTADMLSSELPFRRQSRAVKEAFPQFSNTILVVIDGETPDLAEDTATALTARLRQRPDLFGEVYDLVGEPFMRRNGLLYLDVDELYDLSDRLAEAQPFLGTLWRDPSLRGLFRMLELVIDESLKEDSTVPIEIGTALDAMAAVVGAQAAGRFRNLSWQELMTGEAGGKGDKRRFIVIQPALDFESLLPAAAALGAVRDLARDMGLDDARGVRVRLTGSAALAHEELRSVEEGMGLAAILSVTLVVGLLLVGLRSPHLVAATLATLIMGLMWTAGFATFALGQLNLISVAFAVLFIGLSVDFGIHFGLRYKEGIDHGAGHAAALREAAAGVGGALMLCAVTAAIGFYSFLPTAYVGLAELGLIAGTGMFIAFFANTTVLPALLTLAPVSPSANGAGRHRPATVQPFIQHHARPIAWGALVLGMGAVVLLPQARFDFDPLNLKDPQTESVSTLFDIMEDGRATPYSITILAESLPAAGRLAARLNGLAEVDETVTLADYVPGDQDEKLEIIGTMALFLSPSLAAVERKAPPTIEELRTALAALRGNLERLAAAPRDGPARSGARRLGAAFSKLFGAGSGTDTTLRELETRLLSGLPGRLRALRQSLMAEPVTLADLPAGLRQRQVAADGRARLKVFPKEDMRDREALGRFVEAVRGIAPEATGAPVIILEAGRAVVTAFGQAAMLAAACIAVLLAVLLRNLRDVMFVFAPLTLAAVLTVAASVLFGVPFNFANVIVLPLLFGLGVASAIHFVLRERKEGGPAGVLGTSTPRAVVFSALTTIGSFGSIALSSHPGTSSMGVLLTVAITMTLGCTLVVLPALMAIKPASR
ncbi:MAG: MMPL family transporter [Proteobacteria bacterium]|nr:MMPL family transporter [Pseudomonadota bacterium]